VLQVAQQLACTASCQDVTHGCCCAWAICDCVASVLARDHDIEGMSDGFDAPTAYGQIEGYEDKSMGWAR